MAPFSDDDESVVPLSAQTRRPLDTALRQQRVRAWYPILDPWWIIGTFTILGAVFVPVGFYMKGLSNNVVEVKEQYDAFDTPHPDCGISKPNQHQQTGQSCEIVLTPTKDMEPPILVHYEIENFHQNHRNYASSFDSAQLLGSLTQTALGAEACNPLNQLGNVRLHPCGLIANTFFNDIIQLTGGISSDGNMSLVMIEEGIAWESDLRYLFRQPSGFRTEPCDPGSCDASCCDVEGFSCTEPETDKNGTCFRYNYPMEDTFQYLYETYPQISPLEGVTNEHFVVWMRVAALPDFRKLYGWINQPIAAGTNVTFRIQNNWHVGGFKGRKSLVMSTNHIFGGRNQWLGLFFYGVGFFCLGAAAFFALKQIFRPRRVADRSYLQYKED